MSPPAATATLRRAALAPMAQPAPTILFGVGYERISLAELCELLASRGVVQVLDVRQSAFSFRPDFRKQALGEGLRRCGLRYTHLPAAGNPFRSKPGEPRTPAQWKRAYARHIARDSALLESIHAQATRERTALLCYEKDGAQCHRMVLVAAIRRRVGPIRYVDLRDQGPAESR